MPELFAQLASDTATLVRQEAALATQEIGDKAKTAANQIVFLMVALLVGSTSLLTLVAALVLGLARFVPAWVSAAVIGALLAIVAWALYQKSISTLSSAATVPIRTARSLQETQSWLREQTK
ncbi:MAG TPA: phage holin family protein [Polyangiaceae bacterium]